MSSSSLVSLCVPQYTDIFWAGKEGGYDLLHKKIKTSTDALQQFRQLLRSRSFAESQYAMRMQKSIDDYECNEMGYTEILLICRSMKTTISKVSGLLTNIMQLHVKFASLLKQKAECEPFMIICEKQRALKRKVSRDP